MDNYLIDFHCNFSDIQNVRIRINGREYTLSPVVCQTTDTPTDDTFGQFAQEQIDQLRQEKRVRTAETYHCAKKRFMNFLGHDIALSQIDGRLVRSYEQYLQDDGLISNSSSFHLRKLRAIYNKAVRQQLVTDNHPFTDVYTGIAKTVKRAIPLQDIRRIRQLTNLNKHEAYARDMFLFAFYTRGMSFIDMAYLRPKDIQHGVLHYKRHKTGQMLHIKWEKDMQEIVDRNPTPNSKYLLPIITADNGLERSQYKQKQRVVNAVLKTIALKAGIRQTLSMYVARHSWASIARDMGTPLTIISEAMGHTNEKTTQIYLKTLSTERLDNANASIIQALND